MIKLEIIGKITHAEIKPNKESEPCLTFVVRGKHRHGDDDREMNVYCTRRQSVGIENRKLHAGKTVYVSGQPYAFIGTSREDGSAKPRLGLRVERYEIITQHGNNEGSTEPLGTKQN